MAAGADNKGGVKLPITLEHDEAQELLDYLQEQPYREVFMLVGMLMMASERAMKQAQEAAATPAAPQ